MHTQTPVSAFHLRHSIAPRVLDNSLPMSSLVSTSRFSVRVAPPNVASVASVASSPSKLLTTFVWRDAGAQVKLAGSFDDWRKHEMTFVPSIGYHVLVVELPPGSYEYRFVVDGRWRIVENDPNLREDQFGELSHHLVIDAAVAARAPPKRFSSASVAVAHPSIPEQAAVHEGQSDTSSEPDSDVEHQSHFSSDQAALPRNRDSAFVKDYDDDACGELDLQADVFEAMKDVAETAPEQQQEASQTSVHEPRPRHRFRRPGKRTLRKVWALLFGELREQENDDPFEHHPPPVTRNQKLHGMADRSSKGLKVWFPNEKKTPHPANGRKVQPAESKDVIDVDEKALRLHQVEENANTRQMLGKTLFAQGKYDAALALFSLSVKLREDNGLKYAKTTAIAHTDVASAFIHIEDLKNAEKHLNIALAIFEKGTFSGGRAQLGDVYCFLGVIGDIKGDLFNAESCYLKAIDLYEQARAPSENPNYSTAIENLNANRKRQKLAPKQMRMDMARIADQRPPSPKSAKAQTQRSAPHAPPAPHAPKARGQALREIAQPAQYSGATARAVKKEVHRRPPLEAARPAPPVEDSVRCDENLQTKERSGVKELSGTIDDGMDSLAKHEVHARTLDARPTTWKDLAETARQSMPKCPPDENVASQEDEAGVEASAGCYEDLCRTWVKDARKLMGKGSYAEAVDMYTLAIYTRKRHGPWKTRENAESLVENARALFATKELENSVEMLKDAIGILEGLDEGKHGVFLGEVWGNLGSVLDRIGGRSEDALAAHCAEMVLYGKSGMCTEDTKWLKAWKSLCVNLKMNGATERTNEIWQHIDLQIRGVTPMTKVAHVLLHA
eukprot:TRINITY_DN995_c0_g1_i1.p1 TRINITY_DN995_c0_g1~~TRINITY_DN995_c0_g1_i1.p1  ORF type:complete len:843 (-),score=168.23 TRINITY_DN995_c0_g1_i1:2055-4583(-)